MALHAVNTLAPAQVQEHGSARGENQLHANTSLPITSLFPCVEWQPDLSLSTCFKCACNCSDCTSELELELDFPRKLLDEQELNQQDGQTLAPENPALLTSPLWCGPPPSVLKCGWRAGAWSKGEGLSCTGWESVEEVNPCVSGGFPGRTSLSVSDRIYGCCRALCLIIPRNGPPETIFSHECSI